MPSLNRIEIIGHVGNDPEMRFTPSGEPVTSFNVATNSFYTKDGERRKDTQWFTVTAWGNLAESTNKYLIKGSLVYISGRVKLHDWDKQDGSKGYHIEITANQAVFLNKKQESPTDAEVKPDEQLPY